MDSNLTTLIDDFANTKRTEGKSPKTVDWYVHMLAKYVEFVGPEGTAKDFNLPRARSFIAYLQGRTERYTNHSRIPRKEGGLSAYTVHGYVRTLKAFAAWLYEEGHTTSNVLVKLKRPKLPSTMIEVLTDEEIGRILDCCNPKCFLGARLNAIMTLLLDTGIRADELCTLTVANCDLKGDKIKVRGKGDKERVVPVGNGAKKALLNWTNYWRPKGSEYVFTDVAGGALTYGALQQAVRRVGQRAGVPRLHCHLLRHSFAVRFLMAGGDLMTLKLFLGHCDIQTTQVYLHLSQSELKVQHERFSPVDNLKLKKRK